jgi:hypothetical protein
MIERQDAFRAQRGKDAIFDILYAEQMRDPIGQIERLYARFGEPFTPAARAAMEPMLAANPKGRHGRHEYALEDYGLTRAGARALPRLCRALRHSGEGLKP